MLYAIVDIETTGGKPAHGGITEISIVIHDGKRVQHIYSTLINPQQIIPSFIASLTGISNSMVASAPKFDEVAEDIYLMLYDKVFVAHNVNFDYSFLYEKLKNCNFTLQVKRLCTIRLCRKVFPHLPSYSLGNVCKSLNIEINNRHRAEGDALATAQLFKLLVEHGAEAYIEKMLKLTSGDKWLPLYVNKDQVDNLPQSTGVYYFHDAKHKVIYLGKAMNIKKRVKSHFIGFDNSDRRQHFLRKIRSITFTVCASELHALIFESIEIKRLWPKYNRSQKMLAPRYGLYSFSDQCGVIRLAIDKRKSSLPALYYFNMLKEGRVLLKKMVQQFSLIPHFCYLTKGDKPEKIDVIAYNKQVKAALKNLSMQLPTFWIMEKGEDGRTLYLLMDKGCFYGMGYVDDKVRSPDELKDRIVRYPDNDFIRTRLYDYASRFPEQVTYWRGK
ncbi:MAG: GIY-YIG nuclease family protein [Ferruginibacter sp.]|nr:GIY-YIG nuclease family protein [Ferruginibacter sp.]